MTELFQGKGLAWTTFHTYRLGGVISTAHDERNYSHHQENVSVEKGATIRLRRTSSWTTSDNKAQVTKTQNPVCFSPKLINHNCTVPLHPVMNQRKLFGDVQLDVRSWVSVMWF